MILPNIVFCAAGVVRVVGNGTDLRLYGDNGNYVQIDPGSPGSSYTLVMPSSLGTEGQWYKLGSGGQLAFATITTDDVDGLGTAATLDVGTGANQIVQLDNDAKLPAVDGSLLTGITAEAGEHTHVLADITDAGDVCGYDVGTGIGNIVQLDGSAYLPAINGSQLTNINVPELGDIGDVTITSPTTNDLIYYSGGTWYNASLNAIGIAPASHQHSTTDLTDAGDIISHSASEFADISHTHSYADISGMGDIVTYDASSFASSSHTHYLSDINDAGTAAQYNVGTGGYNIVQLDGSGYLPALNGSQLTNVSATVSYLDDVGDVSLNSQATNDLLYYSSGTWYNGSLATIGIAAASHTHSLSDITDAGTSAQYDVGTSTNNIVQLDGSGYLPALNGSQLTNLPVQYETRCLSFAIFDSSTNTATGDGIVGAVIAADLNGYELTAATASVHTAGTTNTTDIQVRRRRGGSNADMLSTAVTINSGDYTASDGVINTSNDDVATGDMIYIDVDAISTTPAIGLSIVLTFTKP